MTWNGKRGISLTSKERLYEWVCEKTRHGEDEFLFDGIDGEADTYFGDIEIQPVLEEYDINNRFDMEKYMEKYFDENLTEIKMECVRTVLEGMSKIQEVAGENSDHKNTGIREYIYNF